MKTASFKAWLSARGAIFKEGGKHTKVYCNGRQSTLPRHGEISNVLAEAIARQLGLEKPA